MKIAVWHNLPSGGGKRALYYHVRGLVERGHEVEAWCPPTSNRDYLPLSQFIPEHVVPFEVHPSGVGKWLGRSKLFRHEIRSGLLDEVRALDEHCRQCAEQINRGGFDILLANSSFIQAVSSIGGKVNMPRVLYLQEPSRGLYEANDNGLVWAALPSVDKPLMKPRYSAWYLANIVGTQQLRILARKEVQNARAYDVVLVNSAFSRESLLRAYGINSRVCYLGVDTGMFRNQHQPRESLIISLGELSRHKNAAFIVEAIGKISPPRPKLVWVGNTSDPIYADHVRNRARELNVEIETKTNISDDDLVSALNTASVMAYAPRLEPFGFAPLEANACGLPVVAVAEGGVRETVIDGVNGLLVDGEPEAMATALAKVLSDPELAAQLGGNGARIVAEKWSLDHSIDRLENELTKVLTARQQSTS